MKVIWSVEVLPVILKKKAYFPYPFVGKRREFWRAVLFCDILVYLVGSQAFKGVGGTLFKSFFFFFFCSHGFALGSSLWNFVFIWSRGQDWGMAWGVGSLCLCVVYLKFLLCFSLTRLSPFIGTLMYLLFAYQKNFSLFVCLSVSIAIL